MLSVHLCVRRRDCVRMMTYCHLSLFVLEIRCSLQFNFIGCDWQFWQDVHEILFFLAPVHLSPPAGYCNSFEISPASHSCRFHKTYNGEDVKLVFCCQFLRKTGISDGLRIRRKAAMLSNKALLHVCLRLQKL